MGGKSHFVHIQDVKYILPADSIIAKLPNYDNCGKENQIKVKS